MHIDEIIGLDGLTVDERLKKRLVGAIVLASLMVIFVPMLFQDESSRGITQTNIPPRPEIPEDFTTRLLPSEHEDLAQAPGVAHAPKSTTSSPTAQVSSRHTPKRSVPSHPPQGREATILKPALGTGPRAWVLQVGSFSNRKNAEKLVQRLRSKKFPAFQERAVIDHKTVFRVRVGPELDRKRTEKMLQRIAREFKLQGRIVRYP